LDSTDFHDDMQVAHIVMVDDDKEDLSLTKLSLEKSKFPFKFTGLESAEALIDYIDVNGVSDIDVLLLDLKMPETDGLDALKKLQAHPESKDIKRFVYSTSSNTEDKSKCFDAGADGYLCKPSSAHEVSRVVNTVALASDFWV